jgi:lambda family phage portal protein
MPNLLDSVIGYFDPDRGLRRRRARAQLERAYEGAARTDGWRPRRAGASANADHAADARELRIRARALCQNLPYIAAGMDCLVSNTIGTGLEPLPLGRHKDKLAALWTAWESQADADGVYDVYGLQAAAYRAMEQDGEVLVRRRIRRPTDNLAVPLQVQLLEIDWLDSGKNGAAAGGGVIINGIEYDALGKPRAYWLFPQHPGETTKNWRFKSSLTSAPVPAADIIHLFAPKRPGQGRGITRLASVIARSRDLQLYEDAELQRKNLETRLSVLVSGNLGALENPAAQFGQPDTVNAAGVRTYGDLGVLPSGGMTEVPAGSTITVVEPKASLGYVEYCKINLKLIAKGMGVPYEAVTGDLSEVNFSSARVGLLEFRRACEQMQWLVLVPRLCTPLWRWFAEAAALGGMVQSIDTAVDWTAPRWDYVNPGQDVRADVDAIAGGLLTPSEALRRRGYKPAQVFAELASDFKALSESGALDLMRFFNAKGSAAAAAQPTQPTPEA